MRSTTERAMCLPCEHVSATVHETRWRPKRDVPCGGYEMTVVLGNRRFVLSGR